jgi:hypothetical protein
LLVDWDTEAIADTTHQKPIAVLSRPSRDDVYRACQGFKIAVFLLNLENVAYVLAPPTAKRFLNEGWAVRSADIFLLATPERKFLFWAVRHGNPSRPHKSNSRIRSAIAAVKLAEQFWVHISWERNGPSGRYLARRADTQPPDLQWPTDPRDLFLRTIENRCIPNVNLL